MTRAELGARAESAVADYVFARGFAVLARNLRLGRLELDIVARKGRLLAIVEVRTRGPGSLVSAFESVNGAKRARLTHAVERLWRTRLPAIAGVERVRIDVASVQFAEGRTAVDYIEGAIAR